MQLGSTASYGQAWYCGSAEQEARTLLPLLRAAGQTVADVLDLIRVTPEEEKLLQAFAEKFPDLKSNVERSLDYRLSVEKEFCRLARGAGAPRPEDSDVGLTDVGTGSGPGPGSGLGSGPGSGMGSGPGSGCPLGSSIGKLLRFEF